MTENFSIADVRQVEAIGRQVVLHGWVRTRPGSKAGFTFFELNDGSCSDNIQVVAGTDLENYEAEVKKLTAGCRVSVVGRVKESAGSGQATEIEATQVTVDGLAAPDWLQTALTLGGVSLASSLFLGVLAGFGLLWLQPVAMVLGVVMLCAIGYVTMSTKARPFQAINQHVNPVLGWGWALATLVAGMVWALPQYSLASGVLQQNLLPGVLGPDSALGDFNSKLIISAAILLIATAITFLYDCGGWGIKVCDLTLKLVVAGFVICFVGVVGVLTFQGDLAWGAIARGFVPDLTKLYEPAQNFDWLLNAVPDAFRDFWVARIVAEQRDVIVSAAATAVGINMTFLLPYSMLRRSSRKNFRGLAIFGLSTRMFIPFVLATSCVVIAAATQFHPNEAVEAALLEEGDLPELPDATTLGLLQERLVHVGGAKADEAARMHPLALQTRVEPLNRAEILLASHLQRKTAFDLAKSLEPLAGNATANWVFGIGVVGLTLSSITLLMWISGLVLCEMLGLPPTGWPNRIATLAAATGVLGPFVWLGESQFWLAVPTSVFGMILLPIAYITFFCMMNSKNLLGDEMPRGGRRVAWNLAMLAAGSASVYMVWVKTQYYGLAGVGAFLALVLIVHFARPRKSAAAK